MWLDADFPADPNRVQCQQGLIWHENGPKSSFEFLVSSRIMATTFTRNLELEI